MAEQTATTPAATTAAPAAPAAPTAAVPAAPPVAAEPAAAPASMLGTPPATADARAPDAAVAPIEIKLPDGFDAKDPLFDSFKKTAGELGLKSEQAQKIFDLYASQQAPLHKAIAEEQAARAAWVDQVKADPEVGGPKFEQNVRAAANAVAKFGGPELQKCLNETGLGNHPALVRAFVRIGKALGEDSVTGTNGQAPAAPKSELDAIASLYTNSPSLFAGQKG